MSNNVSFCATNTWELCVLLVPNKHDVNCDDGKEDSRNDQYMEGKNARDKVSSREFSTE